MNRRRHFDTVASLTPRRLDTSLIGLPRGTLEHDATSKRQRLRALRATAQRAKRVTLVVAEHELRFGSAPLCHSLPPIVADERKNARNGKDNSDI